MQPKAQWCTAGLSAIGEETIHPAQLLIVRIDKVIVIEVQRRAAFGAFALTFLTEIRGRINDLRVTLQRCNVDGRVSEPVALLIIHQGYGDVRFAFQYARLQRSR